MTKCDDCTIDSGQQSDKIEGPALDELKSRRVDDRQRSSYAVDSTTLLKHTCVITNDAVRIVALLNMETFEAAACLSDKNSGDMFTTVEGHNVDTEVLLVKLKGI